MKKYTTVFFDLDHTLWDFERNSSETLEELYNEIDLQRRLGMDAATFIDGYKKINFRYWEAYRKGEISKEILRTERFREAFRVHGMDDDNVVHHFAEGYVRISPEKTHLFPHTYEVLEYLHEKYSMHIITNGFEEIQHKKLHNCNISRFFKSVITSEQAGVKKPHAGIYHYGLRASAANPQECIMIGDEPDVDLIGARDVGIDQVYFNAENEPSSFNTTWEITSLIELKGIL